MSSVSEVYILFFGNRVVQVYAKKSDAERAKVKYIMETFLNRDTFGKFINDTLVWATDQGENYWITSEHVDNGKDDEGEDDPVPEKELSFDDIGSVYYKDLFIQFCKKRDALYEERKQEDEERKQSEGKFKKYMENLEKHREFEFRRKNLDQMFLEGTILRSDYFREVQELSREKEMLDD